MVNETKSSNRRLVTPLALGALLLAVVVAIIALVLILGGRDQDEGAATARSAELMPQDAFMFVTFNPHLDQAKNFEVVDQAWGDNPLIQKGLAELLGSMQEAGLDYKADIEPWLGDEIAFSIGSDFFAALGGSIDNTFAEIEGALSGETLPSPTAGAMPAVPEFTLAVATTDTAESDKFLGKLRAEADTAWTDTEYKGVNIAYSEPESDEDVGAAYATIGDFVVLTAGGLETMQEIVDAQDGANLASNQDYQDVLDRLPADQIGYGYIDAGAYLESMLELAGPELADLPLELFNPDQLKAIKGAGFSVGLEPNGLRVDFVGAYDKDALPEDMPGAQASSGTSAGRVPASTLLYLSGSGLGNVIQMGLDAVQAMPDQPEDLDEQLGMATAMLGVSVEEMIDMLSGEFAIAVTHNAAGIGGDPSIPVGASFLIEAKDEDKFQRLINSVSGLLSLGAEMEFPKETLSGVEVQTIPDPSSGNMIVGWGVGEGFFAIGTSTELLEAAFGGGGEKLDATATYKAAIEPLPEETSGVFFVNMDGLLKIMVESMSDRDRESFEEARPLLAPIKAISAAAEAVDKDKDSASGTFFILIESE